MKLLCGSDFHGTPPKKIKEIVVKENPDAFVYAGDMAPHAWEEGSTDDVVEALVDLDIPVYAVSGNMDDPEFLQMVDVSNPSFTYLGMDKIRIGGYTIVGFTDYSMPIVFTFKSMMKELFTNMLKGLDPKKTIIVNHVPPYKTKVDYATAWGFEEHAGDEALRKVIEEFQPLLVVCGHIHEARGTDKIGKTVIVNVATGLTLIDIQEGKEPKVKVIV